MGGDVIKVLVFIRKRPDLDLAAFRDYYERKHAPLVNRLLPFYQEYNRNYLETAFRPDQAGVDFDVVTELVFASRDDHEAWRAALADPAVLEQIRNDERNFLDQGSTRMWVVDEHADDLSNRGSARRGANS
jgi:uncharacterized protein (TIGR02118 family)